MLTRRQTLTAAMSLSALAPFATAQTPDTRSQPQGCWKTLPSLPFAVQEIYPTLHRGRVHVAGGLLGEGGRVLRASNRHLAYSPRDGAKELAALPWRRHHPQLVDVRDQLYLMGGFASPVGVIWEMTSSTLLYDDDANAWRAAPSAPTPHAECVAAAIDDRIHLVGGRAPKGGANSQYGDHADTTQHLVFNAGAQSWSNAAPAPTARNSAAGALINGNWHVVGGRSVATGPMDVHEVYDPKEDRWRTAAPLPTGKGAGGNAAAVLDGLFYAFGGEVFASDGGFVHAEVWRFDPEADAWTAMAPMPTPRHGLGAVALDGAILTIGGAARPSGNDTRAVVEAYSPGSC